MKSFKALNKINSVEGVSVAGSVLAPLVDKRLVPYPWIMTIVVSRHCNSRCQMCYIWQQKDTPILSLEQYEQMFTRNDFSFVRILTLSGGEPTLRSDLAELFGLTLRHMGNLERYIVATSGLNTRRTITHITHMLETMYSEKNKILRLDAQVSLDGVGEVHDRVRGISGFFEKTTATIRELKQLQKQYPRLGIRISSVLMPENIGGAEALREFARENELPIHYSPVVLADTYYNNLPVSDNLPLDNSDSRRQALAFFEKLGKEDESSLRHYYQDMTHMIQGEKRGRRCMMGYYGFVLEYDGNIYPCINHEQNSFGNLLNEPFEEIWFKGVSDEVRKELRANGCPTCPALCYTHSVNALEVADYAGRKVARKIKKALKSPAAQGH